MNTSKLDARAAVRAMALCIAVFLVTIPLFSQGNQGRILGTITDQSGGVLANATVIVRDVERGVSRTLAADAAGEYNAPNLVPGSYTVRAEAKGFKAVERQNILVEVGKEVRIDLSLPPGETSQTITVTEQIPLVETTNATLGGTISNQTINDLPLNGRNYINLLALRPGVTLYPGGGTDTRSSNGSRSEDIGYLIDGLRGDEPYSGQSVLNSPIPAGDSSTSLPIDAIQEFNTEENPKAEFGWKTGAIVNAGLKSGTNGLHGTAFAFGRDTALDARNFFNTAPAPKVPIGLEQFGVSVGGPIKKDKLFFFANYEGQRYSVGSTLLTTAPVTVTTPGGPDPSQSLVDACNVLNPTHLAIGAPGNPITPLSAQIAGLNTDCSIKPPNYTPGTSESLFPANDGSNPGGVVLGLVSHNQQDNGVAKVDYHPNDRNSFSGLYFIGRGVGIWNDAANQVGVAGSGNSPFMSNLQGRVQLGSGSWTWTPNSTFVNEFRAGYDRIRQTYVSVDANVNPLAYGINTGVTDPRLFGMPLIYINPFSLNNFRLGGNWPKLVGPDASLQILEHVSVLRGKHAFKFGVELNRNTADPMVTQNAKGRIKFKSLSKFLTGDVRNNAPLSAILVGDAQRHLHDYQFAGFFQDDWRITPRVTLNLGVRYELTTVLTDSNNLLGNFDPAKGLVQVGKGISSVYGGDHNNFSPRVGIAWDLQGDGKTVIRAGGNLMYEQIPFAAFIAVSNQLGLNQVPTGATTVVNGVATPGTGNINVASLALPGTLLSPGWKAQTSTCVTTGSTACGPIFADPLNPAAFIPDQCGDGLVVPGDPLPCNTEAVDPNLRTPYVSTWTLGIQRAITSNLSLEMAYVGTHGTKLLGFTNINQPAKGSAYPAGEIAWCNANIATAVSPFACDPGDAGPIQAQRPYTLNGQFPYLAQIDRLANLDHSNYNALQVTLTQRASHGLSYTLGYTYAHGLDEASSNFNANTLPADSSNPGLMYGSSDFDRRHVFTLTTTYAIPGKKGFGQLLEGWSVNSLVTIMTGAPWSAADTANDFVGTDQIDELNSFGSFWNFHGNTADLQSGSSPLPCWSGVGTGLPGCTGSGTAPAPCVAAATTIALQNTLNNVGCYYQGSSALIPSALGTIGNAGRNIFRDSGFRNWDMSVTKEWKFKERLTAQFRAEVFNALNHPIFTNPSGPAGAGFNDPSTGSAGSFGCGCNTPDQASPNPVLGSGGSRSIQLGLKFIF